MENSKIEAAIVKYLCPICCKVAEEGIIMNSLLSEKIAKEVKNLHGKAIGYSNHACKECAKYKNEGVFIIGIDTSKSDKTEPYRTGNIVAIKKGSNLAKHIANKTATLEDGTIYCFIDDDLGIEIGLWDENI